MTLERIRGALLPFIYQIHKKFSTGILIWQRFIALKTKSNCLLLPKLHLFLRVDPTAACKENRETPMEISKKSSTEMRRLLSKFTEMPEHIKLHHLSELMFNNEDKDNVKEEFKEILGTLPVKLVRLAHWPSISFVLCKYEHIDHYMRTYAIVILEADKKFKHVQVNCETVIDMGYRGRLKYGAIWGKWGQFWAIFWPYHTPPANPVKSLWFKMVCTCVPHIVLHVLSSTSFSGGYFRPQK